MKEIFRLVNSKQGKMTIDSVKSAALSIKAFCDTYIGIYNEKGEQEKKGDRDHYFELFDEILEKLNNIEKRLDELEAKLK